MSTRSAGPDSARKITQVRADKESAAKAEAQSYNWMQHFTSFKNDPERYYPAISAEDKATLQRASKRSTRSVFMHVADTCQEYPTGPRWHLMQSIDDQWWMLLRRSL